MADVTRQLTGFAKAAVGSAIALALCVLYALADFYLGSHVWTIGPMDFIVPLAVVIAAPLLLFSVLAMLGRRARGLPSWSRDAPPGTNEKASG